jgi:acylphosphatase
MPTGAPPSQRSRGNSQLGFLDVESAKTRSRVIVHGFVQGVFFRDTTRRMAQREGVSGWVRNRPEGTVEAVFEGEPEAVERLVRFCAQGPRGASVERIERFEEPPEGLTGFSVS